MASELETFLATVEADNAGPVRNMDKIAGHVPALVTILRWARARIRYIRYEARLEDARALLSETETHLNGLARAAMEKTDDRKSATPFDPLAEYLKGDLDERDVGTLVDLLRYMMRLRCVPVGSPAYNEMCRLARAAMEKQSSRKAKGG